MIDLNLYGNTRNPKNIRECVVCKKTYYRRGNRAFKTCSLACVGAYKAVMQKGKPQLRKGITIQCKTCGAERYCYPCQKDARYCSVKCRGADPESSAKISGENHYNWKGGITPINQLGRKSKEYAIWRKMVFERDNFTCQICGERGNSLNADHIKPWSLFPDSRYELDNGRTLCVSCHKKTPTYKFQGGIEKWTKILACMEAR
jgi:5-methylcytosine-specific restriction endonuclease McrA